MGCCDKVTHGVVGITKAVLHIDRAPEPAILARRVICQQCPSAIPCKFTKAKCRCKECGCVLSAKTANADEKCPIGKW